MKLIDKYFPLISGTSASQSAIFNLDRLRFFSLALAQFILILFVVTQYNFEKSSGIIDYAPYVIFVFILHSFISVRFRPAFLFLSCVSLIYFAFGILAGSFMILLGLALIFICHLPIKFIFRLILILLIALALALLRTEFIYISWMTMSVMYISPLFMFRLIIYLYEIKNGFVPANKWQSISYFFMFPNVFFLFFPIIDYKTYIKTHLDSPENEIWQKGIRWMVRGLIHIMCYRLICSHFLIGPAEVIDLPTLLQYMVANYSLIIRLSGVFHFMIGLVCMFGFNLPPIFDNYFTATSFVDLWRRINIYWRNFVLKIFFYPTMFRYKKIIKKNLLAFTMITVFFITWIMHSYQLFWITGVVSVRSIDVIFWMVIGACITTNSVIIERQTLAEDRIEKPQSDFKKYFMKIIRMIGMFLFMSVMWSLWNSRTFEDWLYVVSKGKHVDAKQVLVISLIIVGIIVLGIVVQIALKNVHLKQLINRKPHETILLTLSTLTLLTLFSFKEIRSNMPLSIQHFYDNISDGSPNKLEKTNAEAGYYDKLIEGEEDNTIGIGGRSLKKMVKKNPYTNAYFYQNNIVNRRMKPNLNIVGSDHNFQSNSFGLRDKEYSIKKPDGTKRLALLGGSYQMGSGVNNTEVFEAIVEERINKEGLHFGSALCDDSTVSQSVVEDKGGVMHLEIFNFAAGGYYLLQHVELVNTSVFQYDMDALVYFAHTDERGKVVKDFTTIIKKDLPLKYPFLEQIVEKAGIKSYMSILQIRELLTPYADTIMKWGYKEIYEQCKKNKVVPVWAYMETTTEFVDDKEYNELKAYAESLGFVTLDLRNTYGNIDRVEIQISDLNTHPNVLGHRLIAERFYKELKLKRDRIFRIGE